MKVVSKSVMRLTVLSIIFCVMIKPIYTDDMEEGVEQELVEDDLQEVEDAENDASMEEQSESDVELFDDGDDEEDDEEDDDEFIMHKGKHILNLTLRMYSRPTNYVWRWPMLPKLLIL